MVTNVKSDLKGPKRLSHRLVSRLLFVLFFSIGILMISCKKDSSQYYVKYEVDSRTVYYGRKLNVELKNESNNTVTYSINQREPWEIVIGPVEKGFTAYMKVEASARPDNQLKLDLNISISKDNGPFTLEKSDTSDEYRDEVTISYKIE